MDRKINKNTAAIHRASVSKAFNAKPAKPAENKPAQSEADAAELQASLGSDVVVKPQMKAKGGMIKSSASKRADGCAIRGKTRGKMV
jgi:succinyl-CoA synthetase beta subunit